MTNLCLRQAKTIYIWKAQTAPVKNDDGGKALFIEPCNEELSKWGRFKIVSSPQEADIILRVGSYVRTSSMMINNQTRNSGQGYTTIDVLQTSSGKVLWSGTHMWVWHIKSAAADLVKRLRKQVEEQEKARQ